MWSWRSLRYRDNDIEEVGGGSPNGLTRIVLLVHGYNNDKKQAEESYLALMMNVPDDAVRLREQIWTFFWPSYVERLTDTDIDESISLTSRYSSAGTESNTALSVPTYARQVIKARRVGKALGRFLYTLERSEGVPTEIVFVAHSLGCRVVLEALREILGQHHPETERGRVPAACLMAAAVPTFMVEAGARLESAARLPQVAYVLHSRADWVLRFLFRPGQGAASALLDAGGFRGDLGSETFAYDEEGVYPEAIGRDGNPTEVWLRRGRTGLGHSGYWSHPSTAPYVLRTLGRPTERELQTLSASEHFDWSLPAYPDLPDWKNRELSRDLAAAKKPLG